MQDNDPAVRATATVVEVTPKTRWIFVEIMTAAGISGVGEGSLNGGDAAVLGAFRELAPRLFELADARPAAWPQPGSLAQAAAISAIDQALWDIAARRDGVSVAQALGGERRGSVPLYANINRRTRDRSPAGFAASARDALAAGFEAFKIAPFDEVVPPDAAQAKGGRVKGALAPGLARIAATREAIGTGRDLLVDCHWRFEEEEAATMIRETASLGLYWVECPLPETEANLPALRRLRGLAHGHGTLLAGCELAIGEAGFAPFLRAGAYDAMMPDAKYVGGLEEMLRVAGTFASAGVAFSPHNPTGPICHAASLQVCAAAGVVDRLEVQFDETPEFDALVDGGSPRAAGGSSVLPGGAGMGMALSAAALRRLAVSTVDLRR